MSGVSSGDKHMNPSVSSYFAQYSALCLSCLFENMCIENTNRHQSCREKRLLRHDDARMQQLAHRSCFEPPKSGIRLVVASQAQVNDLQSPYQYDSPQSR
eukprot:m.213646 g.213646  ORF g.213646 m.213646 type:complete len:100 (+) comp15090_c0_seq1:4010-4309(+)